MYHHSNKGKNLHVYLTAVLKERVGVQKARFDELLKTDLPAFNDMLKQNDLAGVVVPEIKDEPGGTSFFRF